MTDRPQLVLSPADYAHAKDSVLVMADCSHRCWISTAGIATQARLDATTICMRCCPPGDSFAVSPEVYAHLVVEVGQEKADRLIELGKRREARALFLGPNAPMEREMQRPR